MIDMKENFSLAAQVSFANLNDKSIWFYIDKFRKSGVDMPLISICEFFDTGETRRQMLEDLGRYIAVLRHEGFEPVIWTNSLGWGEEREGIFRERFRDCVRLKNSEGLLSGAVCPLNESFSDAMAENVKDFIRAGAKTVLWDDDLVQSVRPGAFCCCEKHLALLEEKTGRKYTPDEVKMLFTGEANEGRSAYLGLAGESIYAFCRKMRRAADLVDKSVRMGLCASFTHYDIEGVEIGEVVRILAGSSRPLLRFSGAAYWPVVSARFSGETIFDVAEFVRLQAGWYGGEDMLLLDENDPYPRDPQVVAPRFCELYDKIMLTEPGVVRHKYFLCFAPGEKEKQGYLDAHIDHLGRDKIISGIFAGTEPAGVRIYEAGHKLKEASLPLVYPGHGRLMADFSQPYGGILFSRNCIPTRYRGEGAGVVCGETARHLTAEQMKAGLVLDRSALRILSESGIDTGAGNVVKRYYDRSGREEAFTCINEAGMKFACLSFDCYGQGFGGDFPRSAEYQQLLAELLSFVSGSEAFLRADFSDGIYIVASRDAQGGYSVLLCNQGDEPVAGTVIHGIAPREILLADGEWEIRGGELACRLLPPGDFAAVRVR